MSNVIRFPDFRSAIDIDGSFFILWPIPEVEALLYASSCASTLDGRRDLAGICRVCVRALIDGQLDKSGGRVELFEITPTAARGRMKSLLDLADRLESHCHRAAGTGA